MQALRYGNAAVERDDPDAAARLGLDGVARLTDQAWCARHSWRASAVMHAIMLWRLTRRLFSRIWSTEMVVAVRLGTTVVFR